MDGRRFDDLARDVSQPASRRRLLAGLAAAAGLLLGMDDAGASKRSRRRRRNRRQNVTICFKGRELALDRAAARALISRGAQPGACQPPAAPGAEICPAGTVPCSLPPSDGSTPACCGPNAVCVTCNPGGDCICCPAVGGSCPSCQAPSFVCCSSTGACSCCAANQRCNSADGSCFSIGRDDNA